MRLVLATGNEGKFREFRGLFADPALDLVPHDTGVDEDGPDYAANALLKARAAHDATGLPSIGDDSGLEVHTLDGFPGLRSARIAPSQQERTRLLLDRLRDHPRPWRGRFVCALALVGPAGDEETFLGVTDGEVVPPRGAAGFGYDPIFLVPETGRTFAQMEPAEKQRWSHRGAAVRALLASGVLGRLG